MTVLPSVNVTIPAGVFRALPLIFTIAVKVTRAPKAADLDLVVNVVCVRIGPPFGEGAAVGDGAGGGVVPGAAEVDD